MIKSKIKASVLALTLGLSLSSQALAEEVALDSTAAIVNNSIILESELNEAIKNLKNNYQRRGVAVEEINLRKQALEGLVTRALILEIANNQAQSFSDTELDNLITSTATRNNTSSNNILQSYGYGSGTSLADAREKFKKDYLVSEVRRSAVRQKIHVSESEVESLAKIIKDRGSVEPSYHVAQVTVPLSSQPTEAQYRNAQAQARNVVAQLRSGKNVEAVAAQYNSGSTPTDLGYVPETSLPLPFVPALVRAKPGDVVGPFRSASGLHILKLIDKSTNAIQPIRTYDSAHILVKTSIIFSDEAAKAKLLDVKKQIQNGQLSFEQAAKELSEDPGSAVNGGNLGYATPDRYDPAFASALVSLKPGQISEPFKSSFGWHIIYLKDIKTDSTSMEAYKDRARSIILEREFNEASEQWERNLREMAYIHIIDPELLKAGIDLNNKE